jgi:hypothetical protein
MLDEELDLLPRPEVLLRAEPDRSDALLEVDAQLGRVRMCLSRVSTTSPWPPR